ncbi:MAG: N,N'-diacetylchitobiose phosphorylase [Lachnospiraceae bacterium]
MNYGYFDEENREYVITRPDTPAPWCNYLGSPEYGAIISNNAGGYSFVKSGANGRILRYHFNSDDTPGRYIYLRDDESGDFWSASWQPVGKDLDQYKSEVHHGTAYTNMFTEYAGIKSEVNYYVPLNKAYEVWCVKVSNPSDKPRKVSVFGYAELSNDDNYNQDQVNLQYTLCTSNTSFRKNKIYQQINLNWGKGADGSNGNERFFGLAGQHVTSYNGDKEAFLGMYHGYGNPVAVERGECDGVCNYNENSCGALHTALELAPGETKKMAFILGKYKEADADKIIAAYEDVAVCDKEIDELKNYWHSKLDNFKINTPSAAFNSMVNTWNAYQCFLTFTWSRAASFIYCGERNGYGYRDTVQDIQGVIHTDPEAALDKIRFMLSAQVDNGGGLPLVKFNHNAGHEGTPDDDFYVRETGHPAYRADDALWLFPTVYKYISETGNLAFIDEEISWSNKPETATVYEHLKRAINFSMEHLGPHGLPAGLHADWNDCLRLGAQGESSFVALQLYYAFTIMRKFAVKKSDTEYIAYLDKTQKEIGDKINSLWWEDDRFNRGFKETGELIGSKKDPEASMWLNPQTWAVISGLATDEQAELAMASVERELNTAYGAKVMAPSYVDHYFDGALAALFPPSTKENGGIFSQTQGWLILAEALMGHGNKAFMYFEESSPSSQNDKAEIRKLEPYVHGQYTEGDESPFHGRSHVHWLTGTASTCMVGCVEGICGIRPDLDGLRIAPSVPAEWKEFTMEKNFRGSKIIIKVENPDGAEAGFKEFYINGEKQEDNYIPAKKLSDVTEVRMVM